MTIRSLNPERRIPTCLAAALWAALAVYCLLSTVAGPAGILAYRRLEAQRDAMRGNLQALGEANTRLRAELESLRSDADRAAREARGLGYIRPDEGAILLAGRMAEPRRMDTGSVMPFAPPSAWPDAALKEIAFGAFLAALALGLAPRKNR